MNAPSEYGNATLSPYVGISAVMVRNLVFVCFVTTHLFAWTSPSPCTPSPESSTPNPAAQVSYSDAVELKSLADRGGWIKFWDFEHQLSSFSARGPVMNKGSEMRMKPDVICPGEEV